MRRREFITLLGGAVAWPLDALEQARDQLRRIAVFTLYVENDPEAQRRVGAFREKFEELGWTKSSNINIVYRWAAADPERIRTYATELVALKPSAILASGSPILVALQRETRTIPIVFVQVDDPLGSGIVASLAHPGGNITGFSPFEFSMGGKLLKVLKDVAPHVMRVTVIHNPDSVPHAGTLRAIEAVASEAGVKVIAAGVRDAAEIERVIKEFAQEPNSGMIVLSYALTNIHRQMIIALAARYRLPAVYPFRHMAVDGGLVSYGIDPAEQFQAAAFYVDRILRGEKPGDLPVQGPTKLKLVVNLKTAETLGLKIPESFLLTADEIIE
jgi:ABC-type uncharacterized transport system substrate-binding protein